MARVWAWDVAQVPDLRMLDFSIPHPPLVLDPLRGGIEGPVGASLDDLGVAGQQAGGRRLELADANQQDRVASFISRGGFEPPRGDQNRRFSGCRPAGETGD